MCSVTSESRRQGKYCKASLSDGDNMLRTRYQSLTFLTDLHYISGWKSAVNCIKYVNGRVRPQFSRRINVDDFAKCILHFVRRQDMLTQKLFVAMSLRQDHYLQIHIVDRLSTHG